MPFKLFSSSRFVIHSLAFFVTLKAVRENLHGDVLLTAVFAVRHTSPTSDLYVMTGKAAAR